jgi:CheY-like chemotaxis protein
VNPRPILIAEDNEANRLLALTQLERLGYEGHAVGDGAEAVEAVAANDYALVLMDCRMPGVDGMTATRVIRESEQGTDGHTIIVAMTAGVLDDDRTACLDAGMDDYLCKPVLLADLQRVFAEWLGEDAQPVDIRPGAAPSPSPTGVPAVGGIDPETFDRFRREVGGAGFAAQFVQIYLGELDGRLDGIRRGRENGDGELVTRLAHTLKSTSATIGATRLADRCRSLEAEGANASSDRAADLIEAVRAEAEAVRRTLLAMGYEPREAVA